MNTLRGRFFLYFLLGAVATTALTVLIAAALARRFVEREGLRRVTLLARPAVGTTAGRGYVAVVILSGLIGAGIAALLAYALSTRLTSPIRQLSDATRRVASGEAAQVPVEGTDELAQLATSFNVMSGQLSRARESERAFLLSVSHELKTPLTAIRGYGEALKDGAVSADEAGPIIERESERLQRLVQDLLDLARLDQRAFTIRQEPVDLTEVARTVEGLLRPRAAEFGVGLSVQSAAIGSVFADRDRAIQVVANLVENALRVTPANGTVTIHTGDGTIAVQDTGPGLTPDDQAHAFDRFFLYRRYGADRPVGSGLGLAIVKELTAAMNGSVAIASEPGAGATFTIAFLWFPRAPTRPRAEPAHIRRISGMIRSCTSGRITSADPQTKSVDETPTAPDTGPTIANAIGFRMKDPKLSTALVREILSSGTCCCITVNHSVLPNEIAAHAATWAIAIVQAAVGLDSSRSGGASNGVST